MEGEHHRKLPVRPPSRGGASPSRAKSPRAEGHRTASPSPSQSQVRPLVEEVQPYIDALVNSVHRTVGPDAALSISLKIFGAEIQVVGTPIFTEGARHVASPSPMPSMPPISVPVAAAAAPPPSTTATTAPTLPAKSDDLAQITEALLNSPNLPIVHSFFLSHVQRESGDLNRLLSLLLHAEAEMPCWIDQSASTINIKTMVHGIAQSSVFMATMTKSYFESRYCVLELRAALYLKKTIVMIHETDERQPGYATFYDFWKHAPQDLANLCNTVTSRPIRRKGYEQNALVQDIICQIRPELDRAQDAKRPLQVLGAKVGGILREIGETAACYVDLGSGQTMVYLLALAPDMSLEYQLVWEHKECFLDMTDAARQEARPTAVAKFGSVIDRLHAIGTPPTNLFQICIGATATYRATADTGREGKARVDVVERWFRGVISEAALIKDGLVSFTTLVPRDEAMFEWLAVKTACTEMFGFNCDAVIAGGSGSVQVSMENEFTSAQSNLKAATKHIKDHGIASYKDNLKPEFRQSFSKIADRLDMTPRNAERPLRLVLISSFYYAAVACKVAQKGDFPRFRVVNELCGPAEKLLKAFEQPGSTVSPKDVANVVRLLAVLNLVTSGDFKNVEILIVREWTVRKKDYKATWTTGKFLHDIRLKVLSHEQNRGAVTHKETTTA
eukprot:m.224607 g.224607  ORF g.224607 m.224607 type:complete len:674 (-) comp25884_c0_seq1:215-2236(-)